MLSDKEAAIKANSLTVEEQNRKYSSNEYHAPKKTNNSRKKGQGFLRKKSRTSI